jgi:hypothetical protein
MRCWKVRVLSNLVGFGWSLSRGGRWGGMSVNFPLLPRKLWTKSWLEQTNQLGLSAQLLQFDQGSSLITPKPQRSTVATAPRFLRGLGVSPSLRRRQTLFSANVLPTPKKRPLLHKLISLQIEGCLLRVVSSGIWPRRLGERRLARIGQTIYPAL